MVLATVLVRFPTGGGLQSFEGPSGTSTKPIAKGNVLVLPFGV